ncbi:hypothetical protein BCR37DRAFT_385379 [Protomyces lactucae-debilis]|uniref:Uncharacterized protein n=1 Tax=Protomyces lactucae-debilis TaxID=2754530 RepID=A0A1Y2FSK8_PROLT|nr:uncharacterized protein BCR37DRAFT_385379 [Protomyces lactucae-debilis]ORY86929.1 hypothetical protein BCR37DRAFT_385379 [Protomyces lactucae-debilis]
MLHIELGIPVPEALHHWVVVDGYADRQVRYLDHLDQLFGIARLSSELRRSHGFEPFVPVTTRVERRLCRSALDEWQRSSGRQNTLPSAEGYVQITKAVNEKADGQTIQYKLIDHVKKFVESDEKKRMNDTLTNLKHSSAMRRMGAGYQARLSTEVHHISSSDPVVRNLGPTRPLEQPVRLMSLALSAPVPRPVDPSAPEVFVEKKRQSCDVHRACKSYSLKTCGAYQVAYCVLHPKSLSRAERSFRPEVLRLWNRQACIAVRMQEEFRIDIAYSLHHESLNVFAQHKLHSDIASSSSKLLGFLQSDANFIKDLLKAYIEEQIFHNPFVQGNDS